MKKVLIPTDFSPHSHKAIQAAMESLAHETEPCHITFLNTYMVQEREGANIITLNDLIRQKSKENLQAEMEKAKRMNQNSKLSFEIESRMGSLKHVIQSILKNEKYDLVVMGKDGGKNVENLQPIFKDSHCQVLIVY